MKKIILTALIVCICSLKLFAESSADKEYAVYNAVLSSLYSATLKQYSLKSTFVIVDTTVKLDFTPSVIKKQSVADYLPLKIPLSESDLAKSFRDRNQTSAKLENRFQAEYRYYFLPESELNNLFEQGRKDMEEYFKKCAPCAFGNVLIWQPFNKRYPNSAGMYKFSRVGFSSNKKKALVYLNLEMLGHGDSKFYILEKVGGDWKVKQDIFVTWWDQ